MLASINARQKINNLFINNDLLRIYQTKTFRLLQKPQLISFLFKIELLDYLDLKVLFSTSDATYANSISLKDSEIKCERGQILDLFGTLFDVRVYLLSTHIKALTILELLWLQNHDFFLNVKHITICQQDITTTYNDGIDSPLNLNFLSQILTDF